MADKFVGKGEEVTPVYGYVRLSREDDKSHSVESQKAAILKAYPDAILFVDSGVSGKDNLNSGRGWLALWEAFESAPGDIVVAAYDRLGRNLGETQIILHAIIRAGQSLKCLDDNKTFDDLDDDEQFYSSAFGGLMAEDYRRRISKKTKTSMRFLQDSGVKLGRPPAFKRSEVEKIMALKKRGLSAGAISKILAVEVVDAETGRRFFQFPNEKTIRKVMGGGYVSREEWEKRNLRARLGIELEELNNDDN